MAHLLLIAAPAMKDPFFERAVVLVWHHDEDGAIGVVINRPLDHFLPDVLDLDVELDLDPYDGQTVWWGGPVESGSGTLVAKAELSTDDGWSLTHGVAVTRSQEVLIRLAHEHAEMFLCLGYAGWGPGQLEAELDTASWLCSELDVELLFSCPAEQRYNRALELLGLTAHSVVMAPAEA